MTSPQDYIDQARAAGYRDDEINSYLRRAYALTQRAIEIDTRRGIIKPQALRQTVDYQNWLLACLSAADSTVRSDGNA
jgi:hypothetical protein